MQKRKAVVYTAIIVASFMLILVIAPKCREHWFMTSHYWGHSSNIKFYGRVVDQDGKPIPAATVSVAITTFNPATLLGGEEYRRSNE